ncbi:hypothetical protein VTN49DRAFT_955 [Thermomyces lanuginosus]|uniref:uncharacterized protein n=1 Tax=Thermomyces lanuginosus TaxID=5541 RepID=UPI003742C531
MRFSFSFGSTTSSTSTASSPSSLPPPPPPPTPNDGLLDITPRKSSFSSSMGMSAACAFPSWPKGDCLLSPDSETTASSYLSDEDLCFSSSDITTPPSETAIEEDPASDPLNDPELTTEEQIRLIQQAAEDERRMRYFAHVQAHARAQQAFRAAQLAAAEREAAKRKKARRVQTKRRTTSSSKAAAVTRT